MGIEDYDVTEAMIQMGGSFVRRLGELFRHADTANQNKLRATFPEYWQKYRELGYTFLKQAAINGSEEPGSPRRCYWCRHEYQCMGVPNVCPQCGSDQSLFQTIHPPATSEDGIR